MAIMASLSLTFLLWQTERQREIKIVLTCKFTVLLQYFTKFCFLCFAFLQQCGSGKRTSAKLKQFNNGVEVSTTVPNLFNFLVGKKELLKKKEKKSACTYTVQKNNVICFCLTDLSRCFRLIVCFITVG